MKKIVLMMMVVLLGVGGYAQEGEYVDLGLPSGTKWKTVNQEGYYSHYAAGAIFYKDLPSKEQWEELKEKCKWVWVDGGDGYYVEGPNGKSIFLPAAGCNTGVGVEFYGTYGSYWSSSDYGDDLPWLVNFSSSVVGLRRGANLYALSVRLVRD